MKASYSSGILGNKETKISLLFSKHEVKAAYKLRKILKA